MQAMSFQQEPLPLPREVFHMPELLLRPQSKRWAMPHYLLHDCPVGAGPSRLGHGRMALWITDE